jgi:hypothetical protein
VGGNVASVGEPGRGHRSHLGHDSNHRNRNLCLDRFESSRPDLHCEAQARGWSLARFNRTGHGLRRSLVWAFGGVVGGVLWVEVQREALWPNGEVLVSDEMRLTLSESHVLTIQNTF